MGAGVGEGEGEGVGAPVITSDGLYDGCAVGYGETHGTYPPANTDGAGVGGAVGPSVVGLPVGEIVGSRVGPIEGSRVGAKVGTPLA